jgi:anti-sigma regulatory factor (Ser/Thr protein kinase)
VDRPGISGNSAGRHVIGGATLAERIAAEIDNDISEIGVVTALIEQFGKRHGLPEAAVFHMVLACDELLTNIISYGFLEGGRHKITASIQLDGDRLETEIVDDGIAFDPLAKDAPDVNLPLEERESGGLGVHFVRSLMDEVDYRRTDGKNYLKMVKRLPAPPAT